MKKSTRKIIKAEKLDYNQSKKEYIRGRGRDAFINKTKHRKVISRRVYDKQVRDKNQNDFLFITKYGLLAGCEYSDKRKEFMELKLRGLCNEN